jgi:hypothetical protein
MSTSQWEQTPYPRVESEAVANYSWREGWGIKAWANGFHQVVGTTDDVDPATDVEKLQDFTQTAYGVGGGLQGNFGPFKIGGAGYMGRGMDGFTVLTFNPILVGQGGTLEGYQRRFRPTQGFLAQASFKFGSTWVMGGFGQARFDRVDTDNPINQVDAFPLIRSQTGISTGLFHRIDSVVLGLDYFNAHYAFDPALKSGAGAGGAAAFVEVKQTVHIINAGVTLEW